MIADSLHIAELIQRSLTVGLDAAERATLDAWLAFSPRNREIYDSLLDGGDLAATIAEFRDFASAADFSRLPFRTEMKRRPKAVLRRLGAAAAILFPAALVLWAVFGAPAAKHNRFAEVRHNPATATLILGDGTSLQLSPDAHATLAMADLKPDSKGNPVLSYRRDGEEAAGPVEMNRLVVPRGCDYRVELSDGTEVWLNADSRLEYPVAFSGATREVRMQGNAYFVVAKNDTKPFIVHTPRSTIRVYGTQFDVSDYSSQSNLTTLVSGSLSVTDKQGRTNMLLPGQQADINGENFAVHWVETLYYTAWKEGYFMFREQGVDVIMEQLSNWYGVDYVLASPLLKEMKVTARIKKYDDIDSILSVLALMHRFEFRINKGIISVTPCAPPD